MRGNNFYLEKCPVCGSAMEITYWDPPLIKPSRNGKYCLCCNDCGLLFGWDIDYGCQFVKKEEAAEEWNKGQAFRYKKMWERLEKDISNYKNSIRICMSGLTKQGLADAISNHMEFIEEEAFREDDV